MILIIHKRFVALAALCCAVLAGMSMVLWQGSAVSAFLPRDATHFTVIVDAGHGGEDGGAVAGDGTVESQLNLEIAKKVNELLMFTGKKTRMTRASDSSIHSSNAKTLHQKKVSDLNNRVELVNGQSVPFLSVSTKIASRLPLQPMGRRCFGILWQAETTWRNAYRND